MAKSFRFNINGSGVGMDGFGLLVGQLVSRVNFIWPRKPSKETFGQSKDTGARTCIGMSKL